MRRGSMLLRSKSLKRKANTLASSRAEPATAAVEVQVVPHGTWNVLGVSAGPRPPQLAVARV